MKDSTKAYIAISLQSLIVGFSFFAVKMALQRADTIGLLAHRFTLAAVAVIAFRLYQPDKTKIHFSSWLKITSLSMTYPISFFVFQTLGLKMISSSEAGIIYAIAPILTLIAAKIVLKEQVSKLKQFLMLISVSGVAFIYIMNGINLGDYSYLGFLLILLSTVSFAFYNAFAKKLLKDFSVFTIVYVLSITSCVVFNGISIVQHVMNGDITSYFKPFSDISFLLSILYLGILSSVATSLLSAYALGKLEATTVGLFNNISTVISILAGTILLKEAFYYYHFIGIVAIFIGTIGFNLLKTPKKE